ncbi:phage portal protein, partial [Listeria monocytogenes]|nr:phage portal protein [Listeria monocytogenes]
KPLVEINALRRNELRNWIGLDPDSEMNELIVLENYIPQDKLGDQGKLKGGDD